MKSDYEKNSLTLAGTVAMGTGVMIGAGIFALTGQVAEISGPQHNQRLQTVPEEKGT